jgi:hypothetical protein
VVFTEDREDPDRNNLNQTGRHELFNQIITSHALENSGGPTHDRRTINRRGHYKLKGLLMLALLTGGSFLLASELPAIRNLLTGINCGPLTQSGSRPNVAVMNEVDKSWDVSFNTTMGQIVRSAGYGFDFYKFGAAGVEFFAHLPEKGYSVVLVLAHGTGITDAIATSDLYSSNQWVGDQLAGSVTRVKVNGADQEYFGLTPDFVAEMCGNFRGALVIYMGCYSMTNSAIAAAFVKKGAHAFVGWNNAVTIVWMEVVSQMLLRQLLSGEPLGEAVNDVMGALGPTPVWGSQLLYYPGSASSYRVESPN